MQDIKGYINSFQTLGAVDGPGIRFVVFMQGCGLQCAYCHNPETWYLEGVVEPEKWSVQGTQGAQTAQNTQNAQRTQGTQNAQSIQSVQIAQSAYESYSVDDVMAKIQRQIPYISRGGGVTVSGGEPLLQPEFVAELFKRLQKQGIHTALDTSGIGDLQNAENILQHTDLVICDIKFKDETGYDRYTKPVGNFQRLMTFLKRTEEKSIPLWVRHVVIPTITNDENDIAQVCQIAEQFSNLEKFELLRFHNMCVPKYERLGMQFPLAHIL